MHPRAPIPRLANHFIAQAALERAQADCVTQSAVAQETVGLASVAEGAAIAATSGTLLLSRITLGAATCAFATHGAATDAADDPARNGARPVPVDP